MLVPLTLDKFNISLRLHNSAVCVLTESGPDSKLLDQVYIEVFDLGVNFLRPIYSNLWLRVVKSNLLSFIFFKIFVDFLNLLMEFLFNLLISLKSFLLWYLWRFRIGNICVVLLHREQAQNIKVRFMAYRLLITLTEIRGSQSGFLPLVAR